MEFPPIWCKWIKEILESAKSLVLVNGVPTFEFQCTKVIRKGDSLSRFLFLIVMEALLCIFSKAEEAGIFKGIQTPNEGPVLSHLFMPGDALILDEWSKENAVYVSRLLRVFYMCSGLNINLKKSNIFCHRGGGGGSFYYGEGFRLQKRRGSVNILGNNSKRQYELN
ncbi:uncharacterized protein LOC110893316 [Helianthus annuus]|uniref:uncharacterized protein LOC110893316 n=1 Tax=Helianthus annuus TaxID=4232 RepID=UPI000B8FD4EB|nr:uncharacterized protein LOC110893316 [Helianthus annuus]